MASYTLESNSPDRLASAMIARYILMPNILVNIVGQLEES